MRAVGLDVDQLAVRLVGFGLQVAVHLLQDLRAVERRSRRQRDERQNQPEQFFHDDFLVVTRGQARVTGSMREAFHAGCRLAEQRHDDHHARNGHDVRRADRGREHQALLHAEIEGDLPDVQGVDHGEADRRSERGSAQAEQQAFGEEQGENSAAAACRSPKSCRSRGCVRTPP